MDGSKVPITSPQTALLENFIEMARSARDAELLKGTLQKTLEITMEIAGAEKGSIFLLDGEGRVVESILTRAETTPEARRRLIGMVLDKGLAGWVMRHRKIGLVVDTERDDRWLTLPDQPYTARAALVLPIQRQERMLGLITMLHARPGQFSSELAERLALTAEQMALVLENIRLYTRLNDMYRELEVAKRTAESLAEALNAELEAGRRIQRDFLPREVTSPPGWDVAAFFQPARQVAGDFYDIFPLPGDRIGLVVGDVCDKGVGAALFMALFRSLIRIFSEAEASARYATDRLVLDTVERCNRYIIDHHEETCMFCTLFWGIVEPGSGALTYVNAGHEPPFFIRTSSPSPATLPPTGPAVGLDAAARFRTARVELMPGDAVLVLTDGISEAVSPDGIRYDRDHIRSLLGPRIGSAAEAIERMRKAVLAHMRTESYPDDVTLLCIRRRLSHSHDTKKLNMV